MVICHRCNANNPGGVKFCANCGANLLGTPSVTSQPEVNVCPSCEAGNPEGANFCASCGSQLGRVIIATDQPILSQPIRAEPLKTSAVQQNWKAVVSMILGIIGVIAWLLPFLGFPITIAGLVLGIIGLKSQRPGMAIAGLVLCCIFLIATVINSALGFLVGIDLLQGVGYY